MNWLFQPLLLLIAKSTESELARQVEYLKAENTILRKLEWYRRGGESSERQWRDGTGIVSAQSSRLDRPYLREWSVRLGVSDLVERALNASGPGE